MDADAEAEAPAAAPEADTKGARALECVQENLKRDQSKSYHRYEAYKSATTVAEFLEKGGSPADLAHDVNKGFVWYLDEGPHVDPRVKKERKASVARPRKPKAEKPLPPAEDDPWAQWADDELDDVCDACGLSTLTQAGAPMANVLICEVCEAERHLHCSGLSEAPEGDYVCPECASKKDRPAKKPPRADDASARARQLAARCLKCGGPGEQRRELFFCEVVGCYGAWHGSCFELHLNDPPHMLVRCPQCRDRVPSDAMNKAASTGEAGFWRVSFPEDLDLAERARLHQILLDQASSLPSELQTACLKAYHAQLPQEARKRKAVVMLPAPAQRVWPAPAQRVWPAPAPPPPPSDCRPLGSGWWAKRDAASGREYYVHEATGQCTWEAPV